MKMKNQIYFFIIIIYLDFSSFFYSSLFLPIFSPFSIRFITLIFLIWYEFLMNSLDFLSGRKMFFLLIIDRPVKGIQNRFTALNQARALNSSLVFLTRAPDSGREEEYECWMWAGGGRTIITCPCLLPQLPPLTSIIFFVNWFSY